MWRLRRILAFEDSLCRQHSEPLLSPRHRTPQRNRMAPTTPSPQPLRVPQPPLAPQRPSRARRAACGSNSTGHPNPSTYGRAANKNVCSTRRNARITKRTQAHSSSQINPQSSSPAAEGPDQVLRDDRRQTQCEVYKTNQKTLETLPPRPSRTGNTKNYKTNQARLALPRERGRARGSGINPPALTETQCENYKTNPTGSQTPKTLGPRPSPLGPSERPRRDPRAPQSASSA
jgi:hypothetical protein